MFGHQAVKNLFVWHALEESEHKAVAFDVYKAVGGSERLRVVTMNFLRVGFVGGMTVQVVVSLLGDRATFRRGELRRSWRTFRTLAAHAPRASGASCATTTGPDFHPDDRDTTRAGRALAHRALRRARHAERQARRPPSA